MKYTDGESFRLDPQELDDDNPFEIDSQAVHLFKRPRLGVSDIMDVWTHEPLFYPARPPRSLVDDG